MALVDTLLAAVLKSNGDGLVMHVGEQPYILTPSGPVYLSLHPLNVDAMQNVLDDLLTADALHALQKVGAVEHEVPSATVSPDTFTLVAARGGDDIWIELRRQRSLGGTLSPTVPAAAAPCQRPASFQHMASAEPGAYAPVAARPAGGPATRPVSGSAGTPADLGRLDLEQVRTPRHTPQREAFASPVVPLARSPIRAETPRQSPPPSPRFMSLGRLLRTAAARGASTLYLMATARPSMRIDDEVLPIETEPVLGHAEVEALILEMAPGSSRDALVSGTSAEWVCELADVGRVRCMSFRDQRGPGAVFRLIPSRMVSAEQLGLSRDIQALAAERDGLILVAGPRLCGKSTLVSALIDIINRTRADYVITLESEIKCVHESRKGMVSQREVRGDADHVLTMARAAMRENPDVLVIDDLRTPDLVALALDAAESGHLVIASTTAHTTTTAIGRMLDLAPPERQAQIALALSESLRGAVAQVLLRKTGGGRVASRELLLNTPSVSAIIAEGKITQLPLAIDSGRKYGMVPLNDALVAFVQSGAVDAREAYRKAYDRVAFLEQLRKEGVDTSFVERLA